MNRPAAGDLEVERLGDGPPVVFVHGSVVGPSETWRKQRELADKWGLVLVNRPGFGASPPLEDGGDFEAEAEMVAGLLGDGAHLVGHSYGAVIALLAAGRRPGAVRSLTVSEPGALRLAEGVPAVDEMVANGTRLYEHRDELPPEAFLALFRDGANSARETPDELPPVLREGVRLLLAERPPWEAEVPVEALRDAQFEILAISGGHSEAFDAVCDALAEKGGARRATIAGRGHTVPSVGAPYNDLLREFLEEAEQRRPAVD